MIYFIRDTASGLVKVGLSEDPVRRLAKMQTDCPGLLVLLATQDGGEPDESLLHERFSPLRERGEWFRAEGDLAAYIADLAPHVKAARQRKERVLLIERLAEITGANIQTTRSWLDRDSFPAWHWLAISQAGIMTLEDLAQRHARLPGQRVAA